MGCCQTDTRDLNINRHQKISEICKNIDTYNQHSNGNLPTQNDKEKNHLIENSSLPQDNVAKKQGGGVCKVKGCSENHSSHFCKFCKNNDSDHFSSSCSFKNSLKTQDSLNTSSKKQKGQNQIHCKVQGCK